MELHVQKWIETYLSNCEKDRSVLHFLAHVFDFLRESKFDSVIGRLYTLLDSLHFA